MEDKKHGGAGRGQGRKKKVREESRPVQVVMPVSLIEWLKFNHTEEDVSAFVVKVLLDKKAFMKETIREVDRVVAEHDLPM